MDTRQEITTLNEIAEQIRPPLSELQAAWDLVLRGINAHMLPVEDLPELLRELHAGHDYILDELGFEFLGDQLRVGFLDERVHCRPADMLALLQHLQNGYMQRISAEP